MNDAVRFAVGLVNEKDLERITHEYVAEIDKMLQHKETELLAV